ncbi:renin receptor-like [Anneissia japonica]|uniref:renin receptor-like n=1 Tax=Anneissia japonica TaxID=1529436 RepID=UPI001425AB3C|nr:renin receptor-like [Anneissia japonica]
MAVLKSRFVVCAFLAVYIGCGLCENTFYVLNAPTFVKFDSTAGPIQANQVQDILALSLGLSPSKDIEWGGLLTGNIFKRPKSSVIFNIESQEGSRVKLKNIASFPIANDRVGFVETNYLMTSISVAYPTQSPILLDTTIDGKLFSLGSEYPNIFGSLPDSLDAVLPALLHGQSSILYKHDAPSLNISKPAHLQFFSELQMLEEVLVSLFKNKVLVDDSVPDSMTFALFGLRAIQEQDGLNSIEAKEASTILESFLIEIGNGFMELYDNSVIVTAVTTQRIPHFQHRSGRSILQNTQDPLTPDDLNVAERDEDFPAFFNIILWMSIILILFIYAVAYGMWYMDPGDTIIYRMTSQRIKMD